MRLSLFLLLVVLLACAAKVKGATPEFLAAIKHVESGGQPNGGRDVTADGGRSIGPLCTSKAAWIDSRVAGSWEDCRDLAYAQRVAIAYWRRYCPTALANNDYETMARIWNGGPQGHKKQATIKYWNKVKQALK